MICVRERSRQRIRQVQEMEDTFMKNNNTSILVGAMLCTLGAAIIYLFKWAKFYFMSASLWQVAEICRDLGRYMDMGGYGFLAVCIYGGAILALVFLAADAFKISKPLLNGEDYLPSARRAGAGTTLSILFTIAFAILILAANDGELSDASITLWPVVSAALCVAAKAMISRANCSTVSTGYSGTTFRQENRSSGTADAPDQGKGAKTHENENDVWNEAFKLFIPVVNYSPSCMLQPAQIICAKTGHGASLLMACYKAPEILEAIRVRLDFVDAFDDVIEAGEVFFKEFSVLRQGWRTYIKTESVEIEALSKHIREIKAARVTMVRIKAYGDSIPVPVDYQVSTLPIEVLTKLKRNDDRDVVCERKDLADSWVCACGRINGMELTQCPRCRRKHRQSGREALAGRLERVEDYDELLLILDQAIEDGMDELIEVKKRCVMLKDSYGVSGSEVIRGARKAVSDIEQKKA